jgi:MHS family shikimate/dehydroshikimate transporter-like MFS transporter
MEKLGGEDVGQPISINRVALAGLVGATVEWYDFFLYGTAAALVFGQLFFPTFDPAVGTILAFGSFAVGYISRPIGGVVFGHFGDKIGRKTMLILTLLVMGVATFLIGLLPTYSAIGIWAPLFLITLRFLQGIGIGGEWGGAVLLVFEHAPEDRRGFYGSLVQIGALAGLLLGTGVFLVFSSMLPQEQFLAWGWRVPFLASIILVGVGLFIRLKILETPAFSKIKEEGAEAQIPIVDVFRNYPRTILITMGARLSEGQTFNIFAVFAIVYAADQLGLPRSTILTGVLIAAAIECVTIPAFGALSDRHGRRPVYMGGAAFCALFAFPFFWLLNTENLLLVWLAIVGLAIGHSAMWGPQAAFFSEAFGTRVRYSGTSFVYQFSGLASSAVTPAIAATLLAWAGGSPWLVAVFVIVYAVVSFVSTYLASETFQSDIYEVGHQGRQSAAEQEPKEA